MSRYKKKIYSKRSGTSSPVRRLKLGREKVPEAKMRILKREQTEDVLDWINRADYWMSNRSSGFENRIALPKEEIRKRKSEAGELLREFNMYYSDDGLGLIKFT